MRNWNDYKTYVKKIDSQAKKDMEEMEELAVIVGAIIEKRTALGISQRDLADMCGIPQSSVARIETFKTTPKIDTLLKIMQPLGLKLTVSVALKLLHKVKGRSIKERPFLCLYTD